MHKPTQFVLGDRVTLTEPHEVMPAGSKGSVMAFYRGLAEEVVVFFDGGEHFSVPVGILRRAPEPRQQDEQPAAG